MKNLKELFKENCLPFTDDQNYIDKLWSEIEGKYSEKGRHYHNLEHLENMFLELEAVKTSLSNFSNISFSVFYHDLVYDATSKSNEEKSAEAATNRLQKLNLDEFSIEKIYNQILATKAHLRSNDHDTNYLLDADLAILGKDFQIYLSYTKKIRKEYSIYPDFLYKQGRKKVLQHFLQLENIFKTEYFKSRYEEQAKENIRKELEFL